MRSGWRLGASAWALSVGAVGFVLAGCTPSLPLNATARDAASSDVAAQLDTAATPDGGASSDDVAEAIDQGASLDDRPPVDAGTSPEDVAPIDVGVSSDRPDAPSAVDAGDGAVRPTCRAEADCAGGLHCDRAAGQCQQCLDDDQCAAGSQVCFRGACVAREACATSRTCPGRVCDAALGHCVDCARDVDCTGGRVCRASSCVAAPRACTSSAACASLGQVCNVARGECVDCATDTDCPSGQYCGAAHCLLRGCPPSAAECVDASRVRICDARGTRWVEAACPSTATCTSGACLERVCAPGAVSCADAYTRRTCNTTGTAQVDARCGAGEGCVAGACVVRTSPSGDTCDSAMEVTPDGPAAPIASSAIGPGVDVGVPCSTSSPASTVDAIWHFRLASPRDVVVSITGGPASMAIQLQRWGCAPGSTLVGACVATSGTATRVFRALDPADYYVVIAWPADFTGTASLRVTTSSPAARAPGEVCSNAVPIELNGPIVSVTPTTPGIDVGARCGSGINRTFDRGTSRDAVFVYTLTSVQDVNVYVSENSSLVAFEVQRRCGEESADLGLCRFGTGWLSLPRQAPGTYYVVAEGIAALNARVTAAPPGSTRSYSVSRLDGATWVDACSSPGGMMVSPTEATYAPIPFPFSYWGTRNPEGFIVNVSVRGFLSFDGIDTRNWIQRAPSTDPPNGVVAPGWSNQFDETGASLCFATLGESPSRRWVVQWATRDAHGFSGATRYYYETVFHEGTNVIDVLYREITGTRVSGPYIVGLENLDGTLSAEWTHVMNAGSAVRFTPAW